MFSQVFVCSGTAGELPHLHPIILPTTGPMSFWRGGYPSYWYQVPLPGGTPVPGSFWGGGGYHSPRHTPVPGGEYPRPNQGSTSVPCGGGGDIPVPGRGVPQSQAEGYLSPRQGGTPVPGGGTSVPGRGYLNPRWQYFHPRTLVPPVRTGLGVPMSGQDWGTPPPPRTGYAWTGYACWQCASCGFPHKDCVLCYSGLFTRTDAVIASVPVKVTHCANGDGHFD